MLSYHNKLESRLSKIKVEVYKMYPKIRQSVTEQTIEPQKTPCSSEKTSILRAIKNMNIYIRWKIRVKLCLHYAFPATAGEQNTNMRQNVNKLKLRILKPCSVQK